MIMLLIAIFFISCTNMIDTVIRQESRINIQNKIVFTGRLKNDTVSNLFVIRQRNYFEYFTASSPYAKSRRHGYAGQYEKKHDTLFLKYYKKYQPPDAGDYILIDTIKSALIYPSSDNSKRLYFQISYPK
jgi:hypothetical protein